MATHFLGSHEGISDQENEESAKKGVKDFADNRLEPRILDH